MEVRHASTGALKKMRPLQALPQKRQTSSTVGNTSSRRRSKSWLKVPRSSSIIRSIASNSITAKSSASKTDTGAASEDQPEMSLLSFYSQTPQAFSTPKRNASPSARFNSLNHHDSSDCQLTIKAPSQNYPKHDSSPRTAMNLADILKPFTPPSVSDRNVQTNARTKANRISRDPLDFSPLYGIDDIVGQLPDDALEMIPTQLGVNDEMDYATYGMDNSHTAVDVSNSQGSLLSPSPVPGILDDGTMTHRAAYDSNLLHMFSSFELDAGARNVAEDMNGYIVASSVVQSPENSPALQFDDSHAPSQPTPSSDKIGIQQHPSSDEVQLLLQSFASPSSSQNTLLHSSSPESHDITSDPASPHTPQHRAIPDMESPSDIEGDDLGYSGEHPFRGKSTIRRKRVIVESDDDERDNTRFKPVIGIKKQTKDEYRRLQQQREKRRRVLEGEPDELLLVPGQTKKCVSILCEVASCCPHSRHPGTTDSDCINL